MMADVVPIQVFILVYLALATIRFFALPWWAGVLAAAAFVPVSAGASRLIAAPSARSTARSATRRCRC